MTRIRILLLTCLAMLLGAIGAHGQQLPQFTADDNEGWIYNNPNVPITSSNIAGGRIKLYVDKNGLVLSLVSPAFDCQSIDSIDASVIWYLKAINDSSFDLSKTALTMAIDDDMGNPVDSVTVVPTTSSSTLTLKLSLPVPSGLQTARLRFVSWKANVVSSGAIKRAIITAVTNSQPPTSPDGDADGNGVFNISDVTLTIQYLLNGSADINLQAVDMDASGDVNISDVVAIIQKLLND